MPHWTPLVAAVLLALASTLAAGSRTQPDGPSIKVGEETQPR